MLGKGGPPRVIRGHGWRYKLGCKSVRYVLHLFKQSLCFQACAHTHTPPPPQYRNIHHIIISITSHVQSSSRTDKTYTIDFDMSLAAMRDADVPETLHILFHLSDRRPKEQASTHNTQKLNHKTRNPKLLNPTSQTLNNPMNPKASLH